MRSTSERVPLELVFPEKIELSLEEGCKLVVGGGENHLPLTRDDDFPQIVEERETVQVINMSNRIVD